jgi:hypothetical protein
MVHQRFDGYGSHLPILEDLRSLIGFTRVVEYGGGEFSTRYFMDQPCMHLTTIESQDHDWFLKIKKINPNTIWMPDHDEVLEHAKNFSLHVDLVFLDTHQDLRWRLAQIYMEKGVTPIVIHDSETSEYHLHEIDLNNWYAADFVMHRPWTMVLTQSKGTLCLMQDKLPGKIYNDMSEKIYIAE